MKKLALHSLLALAACDAAGPDALAGAATADARGGPPRVGVCHYHADAWAALALPAPAAAAHLRRHALDGVPGGDVPGMTGIDPDLDGRPPTSATQSVWAPGRFRRQARPLGQSLRLARALI